MSLPYSSVVEVSSVVSSPAFAVEKQHMLLAMANDLIPTSQAAIEFTSANDFRSCFGSDVSEFEQVRKYFGFLSKGGLAPEKMIAARWYKTAAAPFVKGTDEVASLAELKAVSNGSFVVDFNSNPLEVVLDLSGVSSCSEVAAAVQAALQAHTEGGEAYTGAACTYSSVSGGFIITSGACGAEATAGTVKSGTKGTDISAMLGLKDAAVSQGADAETYAGFCDRIYNANTAGFAVTTMEELGEEEIEESVAWLQPYANSLKLVFNIREKSDAKKTAEKLQASGYSGYVVCYDPYGEYVNILDCAINATIDHQAVNGAVNFNFQQASGYTAITNLGTVVDYQMGRTNLSLIGELDPLCISYVYSLGFGENEEVLYGKGLMANDFATEGTQANEAWLVKDLQVNVVNALTSLNKIKLQGNDAVELLSSVIMPSFEQGQVNGTIARGGNLSNADKISIVQNTGNSAAPDSVAQNGFYYQIEALNSTDIAEKRVRVLVCYLSAGEINKVRIINRIYGV